MKVTAKIRDADLAALLKRCKPALYEGPMRNLVKDGTELLEGEVRKRAPFQTGETLGTISTRRWEVNEGPKGLINLVGRQGIILQYGGVNKTQKYRTVRPGRKLRGWFSGTTRLKAIKTGVADLMKKAAQQIEQRWRF